MAEAGSIAPRILQNNLEICNMGIANSPEICNMGVANSFEICMSPDALERLPF
jgi:hypothetical protein